MRLSQEEWGSEGTKENVDERCEAAVIEQIR